MKWQKSIVLSLILSFGGIFVGHTAISHAGNIDLADSQIQMILQQVDAGIPHANSVLKEVVNINSGTLNLAGVRKVGRVFEREFTALGFQTRWVDGADFERAGHLVATYGERGPRILLIGHLDTVFPMDSPFQQVEMVGPNRLRGPGITDMKGGNVVMLLALRALKESGALDDLQIHVVLSGDEELRGKPYSLANAALLASAKWADIALGFEDGDSDPATAVTGRRGAGSWRLEVSTGSAHSSQIFREDIGEGAIFEVAQILRNWRQALRGEINLTINPGALVAGTDAALDIDSGEGRAVGKSNVIAQRAIVNGDIRAVSSHQLERAEKLMHSIVDKVTERAEVSLVFDAGYPPMASTEGNEALLQTFSDVSEALGYGVVRPVDPRRAGAADISFAAGHVQQALDGLGLLGTGGHTIEETADMTLLPRQAKRAAVLLYQLGR
ncbi:MAG: M20/M25/M40 family metallo-hydrolase [Parahaliea sp.]